MLIPIPPKTSVYDGVTKLKVNFNLLEYSFQKSDLSPAFFGALTPTVLELFQQIEAQCNNFQELKSVRKLIYLLFFLPLVSLVFTFVFVILGISHPHFKYVMYMGIGVSILTIIVIIVVLLFCIRGKTKSINRKYEKIIANLLANANQEFLEKNGITARLERENKVTAYSRRGTLGTSKTFFVAFKKMKGDISVRGVSTVSGGNYAPPNLLLKN